MRFLKRLHSVAWVGVGLMLHITLAMAQPTNGSTTLTQSFITGAGGAMGQGSATPMLTSLGKPAGGLVTNESFSLWVGAAGSITVQWDPGSRFIEVIGTVDEEAQVEVNGILATFLGNTFTAGDVPINEGANTITIIATDPLGNQTSQSLTVHLSTKPPARPTVEPPPLATQETTQLLSGTKTPETSIWINGVELVPFNDATTWSTTVPLAEGDNVFVIATKDAAGNESASTTVLIVADNLPPIITANVPAKTNFNPVLITGTVDDSLTTVEILVEVNGIEADRLGQHFEVYVPLTMSTRELTVTATSPFGFFSSEAHPILLGTIPTITTVEPANGTKVYPNTTVTIQASATDQEADPIEYQILLDGSVIADWGPGASRIWIPTIGETGLHAFEVNVRDAFGGSNSETTELFVIRRAIEHP